LKIDAAKAVDLKIEQVVKSGLHANQGWVLRSAAAPSDEAFWNTSARSTGLPP
jgi:hypothetical protein